MQYGASPERQNYAASRAYCAALSLAGGGWRLPSPGELAGVWRNRARLEPVLDDFWSSEGYPPSDEVAISQNQDGLTDYELATNRLRARCVR